MVIPGAGAVSYAPDTPASRVHAGHAAPEGVRTGFSLLEPAPPSNEPKQDSERCSMGWGVRVDACKALLYTWKLGLGSEDFHADQAAQSALLGAGECEAWAYKGNSL